MILDEKPLRKIPPWEEVSNEDRMLIGESMDSPETRNRWIDVVERILEEESFEHGEQHMMKQFDEVMKDGDYGLDIPRWMISKDMKTYFVNPFNSKSSKPIQEGKIRP